MNTIIPNTNMITNLDLLAMVIPAGQSHNEKIMNAFNTVTSWFIANDGFRTIELYPPAPVTKAIDVLRDFYKDPAKHQ